MGGTNMVARLGLRRRRRRRGRRGRGRSHGSERRLHRRRSSGSRSRSSGSSGRMGFQDQGHVAVRDLQRVPRGALGARVDAVANLERRRRRKAAVVVHEGHQRRFPALGGPDQREHHFGDRRRWAISTLRIGAEHFGCVGIHRGAIKVEPMVKNE
ncbi:hypothetical protein BC828DRAFT_391110 [Blastocladiella britannica]|nr:hypothetical protein BC828DRAFT_391110 [Blastocladiella britannica]